MNFSTLPLASALLAISTALAAGCTGPDDDLDALPADTDVGDELGVVDEDPIDYAACATISAAATSLIESTMTCDASAQCTPIPAGEVMPSSCIPAVSCYLAASSQTDIEPILDELQALEAEYRDDCGLCPVVECLPESRVMATCDEGSCDLQARPKRTSALAQPR
ncbi:MAG: hypothetical protein ACE37F_36010 [Nannocystaceae bacterium]|nr:hypothetical protein [bacterium]